MRPYLTFAIAATFLIEPAQARIGETPEQLAQRYSEPIKQAFNNDGDGLCIYHSKKFKEIRVHFAKGLSEREDYMYLGDTPSSDPIIVGAIRTENPNQHIEDRWEGVRVYSQAAFQREVERLPSQPSGREHTYSGVAKIRSDGQSQWVVLKDHDTVVELPTLGPHRPTQYILESGHRYSVTVLEKWSVDVNRLVGVVSKREHVDWTDCVDDAGVSAIQQLIRITDGDNVVFDHSICSSHHVKMELRNVEIAYGMLSYSKAESYCTGHYPNFRDFAAGGCVEGDEKFAPIYICAKCVAECNEYKRQHPEEDK